MTWLVVGMAMVRVAQVAARVTRVVVVNFILTVVVTMPGRVWMGGGVVVVVVGSNESDERLWKK